VEAYKNALVERVIDNDKITNKSEMINLVHESVTYEKIKNSLDNVNEGMGTVIAIGAIEGALVGLAISIIAANSGKGAKE
jgi:predicted thioesterase